MCLYAARRVPEIADAVVDVTRHAWGFAWELARLRSGTRSAWEVMASRSSSWKAAVPAGRLESPGRAQFDQSCVLP